MEWAPLECLLWNANESVVKLMVSIPSGVSLWYRPCYKNMLDYDNTTNVVNYNNIKVDFLWLQNRYWLLFPVTTCLD